jgi:c-di-GMP-binding flagellar brake protein YcgR
MSHPTLDTPIAGTAAAAADAPGDGTPAIEKRRHPRIDLPVRCWIMDQRHTLYLRLHDLSRGGLSVRAPVPFAPAGRIDVGMELPTGRRMRATGEIVWVRNAAQSESAPRMGLRFLEFLEGEEDFFDLLGNA